MATGYAAGWPPPGCVAWPVSFGLGTLVARPGRSAGTLIAVVIGAATVVFAIGLSSCLNRVVDAFGRTASVSVEVRMAPPSSTRT